MALSDELTSLLHALLQLSALLRETFPAPFRLLWDNSELLNWLLLARVAYVIQRLWNMVLALRVGLALVDWKLVFVDVALEVVGVLL